MASSAPQMTTVPELSAVVSSAPSARPVLNTTLDEKRPLSTATDASSVLSSVDSPKGDLVPLPSSSTTSTSPKHRKHRHHHHHHHHHRRHSHRHQPKDVAVNEKNDGQLLSPVDTVKSHPSEVMTLPNSSALALDLEDPQNQPNLYETMPTAQPKTPSFLQRHLFIIMMILCGVVILSVVLGVVLHAVLSSRRSDFVSTGVSVHTSDSLTFVSIALNTGSTTPPVPTSSAQ